MRGWGRRSRLPRARGPGPLSWREDTAFAGPMLRSPSKQAHHHRRRLRANVTGSGRRRAPAWGRRTSDADPMEELAVIDCVGGVGGERRALFYGWYVVAAAAGIAFVAWGVAFWNIGVFLYAFHEEYG